MAFFLNGSWRNVIMPKNRQKSPEFVSWCRQVNRWRLNLLGKFNQNMQDIFKNFFAQYSPERDLILIEMLHCNCYEFSDKVMLLLSRHVAKSLLQFNLKKSVYFPRVYSGISENIEGWGFLFPLLLMYLFLDCTAWFMGS